MKETGIIMSGNHPKLILAGIKTMSRRVIKLKGYHRNVWDFSVPHNGIAAELLGEPYLKVPYDAITDNAGTRITCPYGQVGDRLWVRETFIYRLGHYPDIFWIKYLADGAEIKQKIPIHFAWDRASKQCYTKLDGSPNVMPSIFMPRWASRITLEIAEVRVERQLDITLEDAIKEGFRSEREFNETFLRLNPHLKEVNPWVWVISFRRLE